MKHRTYSLRRNLLCMATGLFLATMAVPPLMAQSATGAIAGRAEAGTQVTITNPQTGFTRVVNVALDGSYRLSQLPVGDYTVQFTRDGQSVGQPLQANVALGGTTTVNFSSSADVNSLGTVQVIGSRIINRVDVRSTESATNITREELERMPVDQNLTSVALLAPGVIAGNSGIPGGGISFGGSSIAENSVFINGLNVTDFYRRQSFSAAPFAFFGEFQVKTGGYSVEFGRSTGGVINAVTRSGGNEFHGGFEVTFEPQWGRAEARDRDVPEAAQRVLSSRDTGQLLKTTVWGSGPLIKDKLFLFAMYEDRSNRQYHTNSTGSLISKAKDDGDGFWGAKLDWNITDNHLVDLLVFSDEAKTDTTSWLYDFNSGQRGAQTSTSFTETGGLSWSAAYTGYFGDNFVAKAMYGENGSQSLTRSPADSLCDWVTFNSASYQSVYDSMGKPALGCHPGNSIIDHEDRRKVARLDFEWALGDHLLRFGLDRELMTTDRISRYPGSGIMYTAYGTTPGSILDNGAPVPPGVNAIMMGRRRADGGVFDTTANAYYIEDLWNVTPNLILNLGVRVDAFNNKTATGASFIRMENLVSPRLGFSWDMKGDGNRKLFGNLGRYYLPVTNNINYTFAGGLTDERIFYTLNGWSPQINPVNNAPYVAPILGAQIGPIDDSYNVAVADLRQSVDRDMDAVYQDELIFGYQSMLNQAWSWGVNATYRRMTNALDDIRINHTPCGPVGRNNFYVVGNPGEPMTIWGDSSIGCANEGWITIDTSRDGYIKGGSGEVIGYFEPKRTYKSVELQIDRAWDEKWAFNASYMWSKSDGNHEGPVNSDTNYGDTGMVQHWDHPANNDRYGVLFNDHTHQIKLRGTYAINDEWSLGGTLTALSGGPITAFGVTWPNDTLAAASFVTTGSGGGSSWLCVQNCTRPYNERVYEFTGRGDFGRMPWIYNLGANIAWARQLGDMNLRARFSIFNLLNKQEVINVSARYERQPGQMRPTFGKGTRWQSPRYMQLVVGLDF